LKVEIETHKQKCPGFPRAFSCSAVDLFTTAEEASQQRSKAKVSVFFREELLSIQILFRMTANSEIRGLVTMR
jgi:hypothetical protein